MTYCIAYVILLYVTDKKEVVMNIDVSTLEERVAELEAEQIREQFQSMSDEPTDEFIEEDNDQRRS